MKIDINKFVPCAMPCTEEQWQELEPYLDKYGIEYEEIGDFEVYPVIVNNRNAAIEIVSNASDFAKQLFNRTYNPEFSIPFFLRNCGVVDFQKEKINYNNIIVCM